LTGCYLDASAIVKLVTDEAETAALRAWLEARAPLLTSRISTVEVARAMLRKGPKSVRLGRAALDDAFRSVAIVELDVSIAQRAGTLSPATLRALDAIHLAAALGFGDEVATLVTYDMGLADAARTAGLEVVAPS
jgi:predicted nucleic acid-binding protein